LELNFDPPDCNGFDGTINGVQVQSYCGCAGVAAPNRCPGLCPNGAAPFYPNLNVDGLTCSEWNDWTKAAAEGCDAQWNSQRQQCCFEITPPPTTSVRANFPVATPAEAVVSLPVLDSKNATELFNITVIEEEEPTKEEESLALDNGGLRNLRAKP